jgi:hypothetical protein
LFQHHLPASWLACCLRAVIIVAAGVDASTKEPYWLLRSTWGFGIGNYMKFIRGVKNTKTGQLTQVRYSALRAASLMHCITLDNKSWTLLSLCKIKKADMEIDTKL